MRRFFFSFYNLISKLFKRLGTDKDHWLKLSIRELTWPTVANILATLPPISPILDYLSCPLVYVFISTLCLILFNCNDLIDFSAFSIGKRQN
jgi:hypothetical protein